jgi:epoxyqueuosine reductase QueG
MITKESGSSLKPTAVTTDLPLVYDPSVDIGVAEFCQDCRISRSMLILRASGCA